MGQIQLKDSLAAGLNLEAVSVPSGTALEVMRALRPRKYGAEVAVLPSLPLDSLSRATAGVELDWPFPQLFFGKETILLVCRTKLYIVNPVTWMLTAVTILNTDGTAGTITAGGSWHFIDFHTTWLLTNGVCTVFHIPSRNTATQAYVSTSWLFNAGCAFKGRMILGGFTGSWWNPVLKAKLDELAGDDAYFATTEPDVNWVWWSMIGGGDIFAQVFPETVLEGVPYGVFSDENPLLMDNLRLVSSDFMPMDFQGSVRTVLPLGSNLVMVYGDDRVSAIIPASSPVPTFGLREKVLDSGICSRAGVASGTLGHLMVDGEGVVWLLNSDKVEQIGAKYNISSLDISDIMVTFDPLWERYHISDSNRTFVFSRDGLSELGGVVTSCFSLNGLPAGYSHKYYLTEPDFDANVGWTYGTQWSYVGFPSYRAAVATGGIQGTLSQTVANMSVPIRVGVWYKVQWTCGILNPGAGISLTLSLGGTSGVARTVTGTYTEYLKPVGLTSLIVTPGAAQVDGYVTSVNIMLAPSLVTQVLSFPKIVTVKSVFINSGQSYISNGMMTVYGRVNNNWAFSTLVTANFTDGSVVDLNISAKDLYLEVVLFTTSTVVIEDIVLETSEGEQYYLKGYV